ncbi:hypothetical protein G6O67_008428 [Ophiocordyceps sinensis]|uniref:Uncharacterized protein n=1 Tax=Ophiocordyceps sinensis TaxID=72228 RepID=A0A8H4LRZ0_9HYPO|nr:hypothetical protein G6O67_008428 [Ophiocordyceps sinensis]
MRETNFPAWYHRLAIMTIGKDRDVHPADFDQDISDLEESEEDSDMVDACECSDSDSECECPLPEDESDSREERKRELREERKCQLVERECLQEYESNREMHVQAASELLQQSQIPGHSPRLALLAGSHFRLHSADYVHYCYDSELCSTKYVEFNRLPPLDDDNYDYTQPPARDAEIAGHFYFDSRTSRSFRPFSPPQLAGQKEYRIKTQSDDFVSDSDEIVSDSDEIVFQFIGDDYLTMTVGRELVHINDAQVALAPEVFKFVGIRTGLNLYERAKTWKVARQQREKAIHARRGSEA